jgi:hypothetical protein
MPNIRTANLEPYPDPTYSGRMKAGPAQDGNEGVVR